MTIDNDDREEIEGLMWAEEENLKDSLAPLDLHPEALKIICQFMREYTFEDPRTIADEHIEEESEKDWDNLLHKYGLDQASAEARKLETIILRILNQYYDFDDKTYIVDDEIDYEKNIFPDDEKYKEFLKEEISKRFAEIARELRVTFYERARGKDQTIIDHALIGLNVADALLRHRHRGITDEPESGIDIRPIAPR